MHVLVIPSWYPTTEAPLRGIYFAEQAQCLREHGMRVGIVYPEQQSLRRATVAALRTKHFQTEWTSDHGLPTLRRYGWNIWWRFPPGLRFRVRSAVRLARRYVTQQGRPDLIHAQSGHWAGAAAARIGAELSLPYVLTEHFAGFQRDKIFPWRWPLVEEGYRHAQRIAAVSRPLGRTLSNQGLVSFSNIEVHPNLAPTSYFTRPSDRRPPPPFRFVTVTRLGPPKNVGDLLRAFAQFSEGDGASTLVVVGDGPHRKALEKTSQQLGVDDRVSFRGRLDRDGVRAALWNAHAFVLPSRHESFGVVLLEAMATGLPVVATRSGGPEDIVPPDAGILVPPKDIDALTSALREIRTRWSSFDPDEIRSYTLDHYGPEPFVRRTRLLYRRALNETV